MEIQWSTDRSRTFASKKWLPRNESVVPFFSFFESTKICQLRTKKIAIWTVKYVYVERKWPPIWPTHDFCPSFFGECNASDWSKLPATVMIGQFNQHKRAAALCTRPMLPSIYRRHHLRRWLAGSERPSPSLISVNDTCKDGGQVPTSTKEKETLTRYIFFTTTQNLDLPNPLIDLNRMMKRKWIWNK